MFSKHLFDRRYGKGAFDRLRSMLDDPQFAYQDIANKFGVTRQYIAQLANELGINGRQRQHQRTLRRGPHVIKNFDVYPRDIQAVMHKIRRAGLRVTPYNSPQPSLPNFFLTLQKMALVNGVLCTIQLRKGGTKAPNGRAYARFDVNDSTKRGKVALWATRSRRTMRLYVIPLTHLRNVSSVYIPVEGKYAVGNSHKPRKDWTRYERAWHLIGDGKSGAGT
jgi:hypothetical protein